MYGFARTLGLLNLISGLFLMLFPNVARSLMQAREEYAHLSDNALRLLGGWMFLSAGPLIIAERRHEEVSRRTTFAPERRVAA